MVMNGGWFMALLYQHYPILAAPAGNKYGNPAGVFVVVIPKKYGLRNGHVKNWEGDDNLLDWIFEYSSFENPLRKTWKILKYLEMNCAFNLWFRL